MNAAPDNGRTANEQGFFLYDCPMPAYSAAADQWRQQWEDAQIDRELWESENFHACHGSEG